MNVSREWLTDFLDRVPPYEQLADALTMGGLPTENFTHLPDGDVMMDVEVTSNRSDCLSHIGVARELAALLDLPFKPQASSVNTGGQAAADAVKVRIDDLSLCPHYTARIIRNVKIGASPRWMTRRLEAIGVRSINNVVDITNYVLFELGQPLHAFDFSRVGGSQIIVRSARQGEVLRTLDGHDRKLEPWMLVIADEAKPVALAGVMGGAESEVSAGTTTVLLESARFDPLTVRRAARALALMSDSSYRFERGIDSTLPHRASDRACQLLADVCGGEVLAGTVEAGTDHFDPQPVTVRLSRMSKLLGVELPTDAVINAYQRLGLGPKHEGDLITCTPPSHRLDIAVEVDLIEEAARIVGYDKIPVRDRIEINVTPPQQERVTQAGIRQQLAASGYFESITFSFVADALRDLFMPGSATGLLKAAHAVRKADGHLRPSLLPGLLQSLRHNETVGNGSVRLFETGSVFWRTAEGHQEHQRLALVGGEDFRELRGTLESLLHRLDKSRKVTVTPAEVPGFASAGRVTFGDAEVGHIGIISGKAAGAADLRKAPPAAELDLTRLVLLAVPVPTLAPLPRYPATERDVSFVLAERTPFADVEQLVRKLNPADLEAVDFAGVYRGKPLEKGTKSLTLKLLFRSAQGTLRGEDVDAEVEKLIHAAKTELNATIRA